MYSDKEFYPDKFHFRRLKIKGISADFPISIMLYFQPSKMKIVSATKYLFPNIWIEKREFLPNLPFLAIPMGLFSCLKFEPLVQFVEKGKEINVSLYYESQ